VNRSQGNLSLVLANSTPCPVSLSAERMQLGIISIIADGGTNSPAMGIEDTVRLALC